MMTLHEQATGFKVEIQQNGAERREHRRHDLEQREVPVERWDGSRRTTRSLGRIMDLSASGVRIRTSQRNLRPDNQIRVRIELPAYAGISPFIDSANGEAQPANEWVGWMSIARVQEVDDETVDVAGRLVDMDDMDRGMLGLYLSTQPLAA
jgi:hypothetical protein